MDLNIEFIQGVLFIRLSGELTSKTLDKFENNINDLIDNSGITNVVMNMEKLSKIDKEGIKILRSLSSALLEDNGNLVLCNVNDKVCNNYNLYTSKNELTALKLLNI